MSPASGLPLTLSGPQAVAASDAMLSPPVTATGPVASSRGSLDAVGMPPTGLSPHQTYFPVQMTPFLQWSSSIPAIPTHHPMPRRDPLADIPTMTQRDWTTSQSNVGPFHAASETPLPSLLPGPPPMAIPGTA